MSYPVLRRPPGALRRPPCARAMGVSAHEIVGNRMFPANVGHR